MKEARAELWDEPADARCVTTNGVVRDDGTLVMGAGCAGEAQSRYPQLPGEFGTRINDWGNHVYAIRIAGEIIISFPTKHDWRDNSDLDLIKQSAAELMQWLRGNPEIEKVLLPRPGCGLGFLDWETQVKPALEGILDNRVTVITNV